MSNIPANPAKIALTVDEFVRLANISKSHFYRQLKAGRIKSVKVGHKRLIPASEPSAWLARLAEEA